MSTTSPEYLPTYLLPVNSYPALTDSVLIQNTHLTNGDVGLTTVIKLLDAAIDTSTTTLFTTLGWEGVQ